MTSDVKALDLTPLDRALADLAASLDGHSLEEVAESAGQIFQSAWRDNIRDAGLEDTHTYIDSIEVNVTKTSRFLARVEVGAMARREKGAEEPNTTGAGAPYPFFLEYGTSDISPHPVAQRAFDTRRRAVVQQVSADIARKVKSRKGFR